MAPAASLDRYDLKILAHLEREGRCSNVDLANAVGLSQSPCLVRMKRLQQIGVIRGYGADIALEKLGSCVVVFVELTIGSHRPVDFRMFEEAADHHDEIVEWYRMSGGYDYLLKVVAPSITHFQALMECLLEDGIGIEKFTSRIVLRQSSGKRRHPLHLIAGQLGPPASQPRNQLPCPMTID